MDSTPKKKYERNRDYNKEYNRFKEKHPDLLTEVIICPCGGSYKYLGKARHFKTKRHQYYEEHGTVKPRVPTNPKEYLRYYRAKLKLAAQKSGSLVEC